MIETEIGVVEQIPQKLAYLNKLKSQADWVSSQLEALSLGHKADRIRVCGEALKVSQDAKSNFCKIRQARFCRVNSCPICDAKWSSKVAYQIYSRFKGTNKPIRVVELSFSAVDISQLKEQLSLIKRQKQRLMQRLPFADIKDHVALFNIEIWSTLAITKVAIYHHDLTGKQYLPKAAWKANSIEADLTDFKSLKIKDVFGDVHQRSKRPLLSNFELTAIPAYLEAVHKFRFVTTSRGFKIDSKPIFNKQKGKTRSLHSHWYGWLPNPEDQSFCDEYLKLHDFDPTAYTLH